MSLNQLREFFMWCSIINGAMLVFGFLFFTLAGGWIHKMHGKIFPMKKETFNIVLYSFMGIYKTFFIIFNLVPFIAISLVIG